MKRIKKKKISDRWWIWVIPAAVVLTFFYLYPMIEVVRLSFTDTRTGTQGYSYTMMNYIDIFRDEEFYRVLGITFIFVGGSVFFQLLLGLLTAMLMNKELFGNLIVKIAMITAWVVPGIIAGIIWEILFSSSNWGVVNYFLSILGINKIPFLYSPGPALFAVTFTNIWRGTGFSGILQYAALRGIPDELYEAAKMDGANKWQQFWNITIPQLKPMLLINSILITIFTLNTYDSIYSLTKGGPAGSTTVLSLKAYKEVFEFLRLGKGAAYSVILLLISIGLTFLYFRFQPKEE